MMMPDAHDFDIKISRVRAYLSANGFTGMILGRRDNFAWLTGGSRNTILRGSELGFCEVVVTVQKVFVVAQYMDVFWLMDHMLKGLDVELVELKWFEASREEKALELAGKNAVGDTPLEGARFHFKDIVKLHYPMTKRDMMMYREWGELSERIIAKVAGLFSPGMKETEIEALTLSEYAKQEAHPEVLLIGSDWRIEAHRHPVPTDKTLEKTLLIHPAMNRFGQNCCITRMVSFGEPDEKLRRDYDFLNLLQAQALAMTKPGARMGDIAARRKALLQEHGYGKEWEHHYPGSFTGYFIGTAQWVIDDEVILEGMCFDWFITVSGAKVEELAIAASDGAELLSVKGHWPTKEFAFEGKTYALPDILVR